MCLSTVTTAVRVPANSLSSLRRPALRDRLAGAPGSIVRGHATSWRRTVVVVLANDLAGVALKTRLLCPRNTRATLSAIAWTSTVSLGRRRFDVPAVKAKRCTDANDPDFSSACWQRGRSPRAPRGRRGRGGETDTRWGRGRSTLASSAGSWKRALLFAASSRKSVPRD